MGILPGKKGGKKKGAATDAKPDKKASEDKQPAKDTKASGDQAGASGGKATKPGGNTPANTPTTYYVDTANPNGPCEKNFKTIKDKCGPDDKEDEKGKKKVRPSIRKLLGKKYAEKGYGNTLSKGGTDNKSWMADNCDFLWIPPGANSHEEFLKKLEDLKKDLTEGIDNQLKKMLNEAKDKLQDKALAMAKEKAAKGVVRMGGRWVVGAGGAAVGGVRGLVTEGIATVWNLWDMGSTGYEVVTTGYDMYKDLGPLKEAIEEYGSIADEFERLGKQVKEDPQKAIADFMTVAGKVNPCVRARRCSLVPYNANNLSGHGCCPGQTGHHLIPDSAAKDAGCKDYTHGGAPTVCAEGVGNGHGGSHGMLHNKLDERMKDYAEKKKSDTMSYDDYRNHAIKTFQETFPESKCDRKCLQAQLDAYYKCSKNLKAVSGKGGGNSKDMDNE
jgi:hypothetical protein